MKPSERVYEKNEFIDEYIREIGIILNEMDERLKKLEEKRTEVLGKIKKHMVTGDTITTDDIQEEPKRWRPKKGDRYYIINSSLSVDFYKWDNDNIDDLYYESGNYFRTEQEAKEAAKKVKELLLSLH